MGLPLLTGAGDGADVHGTASIPATSIDPAIASSPTETDSLAYFKILKRRNLVYPDVLPTCLSGLWV
jgi:hypothetical protein